MSRPAPRTRAPAAALPARLPTWTGAVSAVLRPGTATPPLAGHPWVFSGAIAHVVPGPDTVVEPGIRCALFDQHARYLGVGYYNATSQIAVRMMGLGQDGLEPDLLPDLAVLTRKRMAQAVALRQSLGLPSAETDAYRMVNSEGDFLPGVTIDCYADGAVVQLSTAGAWRLRTTILAELQRMGLKWQLVRVPLDIHPSEGLLGGSSETHGPVPNEVKVHHNGLQLRVEPAGGQKTGMYCDQRDNHTRIASLSKGLFVVDAFCHAGGFALHAARGGAKKVVCVDASQRAVDLAIQHAEDNGLVLSAQCADAVHVLRQYSALQDLEKPQLVIIDPPKYATKAAALDQAVRKYQALNAVALQAVRSGGLLVTCSCSGLLEPEAFLRMIGQAAQQAGVTVQLLELRSAAPDHPTAPAHGEGRYLKVAICRVTPRDAV